MLVFSSSRLVREGETFVAGRGCSVVGGGGGGGDTVFFSFPSSFSSSDEELSESSLASDSECFECSELFDFERLGEGECEPELDWDEDEEDWDEVEEDLLRAFGDGARLQGSTHWSPACPNLVVVFVTWAGEGRNKLVIT